MSLTIYHNPNCSKSRATLEIINEASLPVSVVDYLATPPNTVTVRKMLIALGLSAIDIVRKNEPVWKESGLTENSPEAMIIQLLVDKPIALQRPIVTLGDKAIIGRPPSNVLHLING